MLVAPSHKQNGTRLWQKFFALSPLGDRKKVTGKFGVLWDLGGDHHKHLDRYIAVLAFKNTWIVSCVVGISTTIICLAVVHCTVEISNLTGLPPLARAVGIVSLQAYIHSLLMGYSIFFSLPFYFLIFVFNVKRGDVDIYRYDHVLKREENRTIKNKLIRFFVYIAALPLGYIMSFSSYSILAHLVRWGNPDEWHNSYALLLSYCAFSTVAHAFAAVVLYLGVILAYGLFTGYCSKK